MTSCIDLLNNLPTQERAETQASGTAKNTVSATRLNSKSSIIKSHLKEYHSNYLLQPNYYLVPLYISIS